MKFVLAALLVALMVGGYFWADTARPEVSPSTQSATPSSVF